MLDKLHYCVQEIKLIKELLKIENTSFYKRSLSRFVAIRTLDYHTLASRYKNTSTTLSPLVKVHIKKELNALLALYNDFFKIQRDKFSGHFQDLDLTERIDKWAAIDFTKTEFFIDEIVISYNNFKDEITFQDIDSSVPLLTPVEIENIRTINLQFNLEKRASFGNDILAITRPNTGAIITFGELNTRCSTITAIDLLLRYELALLNIANINNPLHLFFKEICIVDVISLYDNIFTRSVVDPIQELKGLDSILVENELEKEIDIVKYFKKRSKLEKKIDALRNNVRNKICAHIDTSDSLEEIKTQLINVSNHEINFIHSTLISLFKKICANDIRLRTYLIDSFTEIKGISGIENTNIKQYDDTLPHEIEYKTIDYNDNNKYDEKFEKLILNENDRDSLDYFRIGIQNSSTIETINKEIPLGTSGFQMESTNISKILNFLKEKLINERVSENHKIIILNVFIYSKNSNYRGILQVLKDTYSIIKPNYLLRLNYINTFGEISYYKDENILSYVNEYYENSEVNKFIYSILCLFKIDVKDQGSEINGRRVIISRDLFVQIVNLIDNGRNILHKLAISLALPSVIFFNGEYDRCRNYFETRYKSLLENLFIKTLEQLIQRTNKEVNFDKNNFIKELSTMYSQHDYTYILIKLGTYLIQHNCEKEANFFYEVSRDNLVIINNHHTYSIYLKAIILNRLGNNSYAIDLLKTIALKNPDEYYFYITLLEIYSEDKNVTEFNETKDYLLTNYNLEPEELSLVENLKC